MIIKSEKFRKIEDFFDLMNSFKFQLGYHLDDPLIEVNSVEELQRIRKVIKIRRLKFGDLEPPKRRYIPDLIYYYQMGISSSIDFGVLLLIVYRAGLSVSGDNIIIGNTVKSNRYRGISLSFSNSTIISGNNLSYNYEGIYLYYSNNNNNSGNNLSYNYEGIHLAYSNYNIILGNIANFNTHSGIILDVSPENSILRN